MTNIKLDIDRLHRCVEDLRHDQFIGRGAGATTARIEMLVGDVLVGDPGNSYIFLVDNHHSVSRVRNQIAEALCDAGVGIVTLRLDLIETVCGTTVRIMSAQRLLDGRVDQLRGLRIDRVFFDVSPHTLAPIDQCAIDYGIAMMKAAGADFL